MRLLTLWPYGPLRTLAPSTTDAHFLQHLPFAYISSLSAPLNHDNHLLLLQVCSGLKHVETCNCSLAMLRREYVSGI
jgi:hypothetical protein